VKVRGKAVVVVMLWWLALLGTTKNACGIQL
jgi:hypothetical protein